VITLLLLVFGIAAFITGVCLLVGSIFGGLLNVDRQDLIYVGITSIVAGAMFISLNLLMLI